MPTYVITADSRNHLDYNDLQKGNKIAMMGQAFLPLSILDFYLNQVSGLMHVFLCFLTLFFDGFFDAFFDSKTHIIN